MTVLFRLSLCALYVCMCAAVQAELVWRTGTYDPGSWSPQVGNLLADATVTQGPSYYSENGKALSQDLAVLASGAVAKGVKKDNDDKVDYGEIVAISGGSIAWSFAAKQAIQEIRLFTRWCDGGRDGIAVSAVSVKYEGSDGWTQLPAPAVSYGMGNNNTSSALRAVLADAADEPLAAGIVALKLDFGQQDNNGTGYTEIEVVSADYRWSTATWDFTTWAPGPNNVLAGLPLAEGTSGVDGGTGTDATCGKASDVLTDGTAKGPQTQEGNKERGLVQNNAVLVYQLAAPADLKELRFYAVWNDGGRDRIDIAGIDASTDGGATWRTIPNSSLSGFESSAFRNRADFFTVDGSPLAVGANAVRIRFGGQENGYVGYIEIEALAASNEPSGRLEVKTRRVYDVTLSGVVSDLGRGAASADVYLSYGLDADSLPEPQKIGTVETADGFVDLPIAGLQPNTTYTYRWYIASANGYSTTPATGTFTTASLVPVVDHEVLVVPTGDFADVPANGSAAIASFLVDGTLTVGADATFRSAGTQLPIVGNGNSPESGRDVARVAFKAGATAEIAPFGEEAVCIGYNNGRGILTVEAGATFSAPGGNLILANNVGEATRTLSSYGQLDIFGTVKVAKVSANAWYPATTATPTPLEYIKASEINLYDGGTLETGLYRGYDCARCDINFRGGTLRFTPADEHFFAADSVCFVWNFEAGTTSTIDVGDNDVAVVHPNNRFYLFGGGVLRKRGKGTLTLDTNDGDFTGKIIVEEGGFSVGAHAWKGLDVEVRPGAQFIGRADMAAPTRVKISEGADFLVPAQTTARIHFLDLAGTATLTDADSVLQLDADVRLRGEIRGAGSLVKAGAGTTYASEANTYSGDTRVKAGTYTILPDARGVRYAYWRLVTHDSGLGGCMQLSRLALFDADGQVVSDGLADAGRDAATTSLKPGQFTANVPDGHWNLDSFGNIFKDDDSKVCTWPVNGAFVTFRLPDGAKPVSSYNLRSGNDDSVYQGRSVRSWTLEGSNDGENWVAVDAQTRANMTADNAWYNATAYGLVVCDSTVTTPVIPFASCVDIDSGAALKVCTGMTLSKLRLDLDAQEPLPLIDGFIPAAGGELYLTSETTPVLEEVHVALPLALTRLGAAAPAGSWAVYLNGVRLRNYRFVPAEGAGASQLQRLDGFQVLVR